MQKLWGAFIACLWATSAIATIKEVKLEPNGVTELTPNTAYKISAGGTYTITTNGKTVASRIAIYGVANPVTLILDNCKIVTPDDLVTTESINHGAPIIFTGRQLTLNLQFRGANELACSTTVEYNRYASAITFLPNNYNRTFALTLEGLDEAASLTLSGRSILFSNPEVAYAPIYFPQSYVLNGTTRTIDATVSIKRGKLALVTSTTPQAPYLSPAITAKKITLDGATLYTAIKPATSTAFSWPTWQTVVAAMKDSTTLRHALFDCETFSMSSGTLCSSPSMPTALFQTNTFNIPTTTHKINQGVQTSYSQTYLYPTELLTLPSSGVEYGVCASHDKTTFYGLPLDTASEQDLAHCFTPDNATLKIDDKAQTITVLAQDAAPVFSDPMTDATTAVNAAKVFDLPLSATEQGFVSQPYHFGIQAIKANDEKIVFVVALDLPNVAENVSQYELMLNISSQERVVYAAQTTFYREAGSTLFLATCPTDETFHQDNAPLRCYHVKALSE
jgi:hypothetical protein